VEIELCTAGANEDGYGRPFRRLTGKIPESAGPRLPRLCRFCADSDEWQIKPPKRVPLAPDNLTGMTRRHSWQALALAGTLLSSPSFAEPDYPDRDNPDIDLYALMSGKCPTLQIPSRSTIPPTPAISSRSLANMGAEPRTISTCSPSTAWSSIPRTGQG
jgi:hypothetical protein